jgi:hypothetical protein
MEVCGLEMKEAHDLYVQSGYNFEVKTHQYRQQSVDSLIINHKTCINPMFHPRKPITISNKRLTLKMTMPTKMAIINIPNTNNSSEVESILPQSTQ